MLLVCHDTQQAAGFCAAANSAGQQCSVVAAESAALGDALGAASDEAFRESMAALTVREIGSSAEWPEAMFASVNTVVHRADLDVAAQSGMEAQGTDPLSLFREHNLDAVIKLAEAAASAGVKRFVYLSSTEVERLTGGDGVTPQTAMSPRDYYAISKQEGEKALQAVGLITGMEVVIVRAPEVYRARCDGWVAGVIRTLRSGQRLPFAGVKNRLALISDENLADALLLAATHERAAEQTWTVADAEAWSTPDLLDALGAHIPEYAGLKRRPLWLLKLAASAGQGEALQRYLASVEVDTSAIEEHLGWRPVVSVAEGLRRAVEFQAGCGKK